MANVKVLQDTEHELVGGAPHVEIIDIDRTWITESRFWVRLVNAISLLALSLVKVVSAVNRLGNNEIDSARMKTRPDHSIGMRKWNL
jgi:hypothetical protein